MPETPSSQLRSETLDLIVDILKHPERHGDPFLVKFVTNSTRYKNGYMAISLLRSMVKELNKVPTGYIVHCALNDPDRLELSIDRTRVRLSKTFEDVQVLGQEIDPPAYVRKEVAIEEFQTADSQEEQQMMDTSNTVFKPFKPLFSSEKRASVLSVCFVNGKFYVDHLVDGRAPEDQPVMEIPQYDKPDILPLGQESMVSSGARCWNCGEEGHVFTACPEPRNQANIAEARKLFGKEDAISSGRFFEELAFQNRIAAMAPGRLSAALKDALQMSENDEPPYYPNMRRYGYPPGYYGAEEGEDQLAGTTQMRRRFAARGWSVEELSDNSSILKVYDDEEDYEATMEEDTNLKMEPGRARLIKLVHYPGLDLKLRDDAETQQLQYAWYQYYSSHYPELVQYSPDWISGFEYHSYPTTSNLAQSQQHSDDKNHLSAQSNMNNFTGDESDMEISDDDDE